MFVMTAKKNSYLDSLFAERYTSSLVGLIASKAVLFNFLDGHTIVPSKGSITLSLSS